MLTWIAVGDKVLNTENIEYIERISQTPYVLMVHMVSGQKIELRELVALQTWKYISGRKLKFLILDTPERSFSGT